MVRPLTSEALLRTESLWVWYGPHAALRGVTLEFPLRGVTAILGPSGCGKTTLFKAFNRTLDSIPGTRARGTIWWEGTQVLAPTTDVLSLRRRVALVNQESVPFPLSIFDNVAYGPRVAGDTDPEQLERLVEESLRRAALWDEVRQRLRTPASRLSGGQQRRLCIARALATRPGVLLLDEPTAMLDPGSTARIEDLLGELQRDTMVIVVTHQPQQAARISETTAFLHHGELVEVAPTREFFTRPREPRSEAYLMGRLE